MLNIKTSERIYKKFIIHQYDNLDSTNSLAIDLARINKIYDYEIVTAKSQNLGRGRSGKNWISKEGNLYFSLVVRPNVKLKQASQLSFVMAVCLAETFLSLGISKESIKCKWPNDILINSKKISGILLESENVDDDCKFLVIGVGVNIVNFDSEINDIVTSLSNFNISISSDILLDSILDSFEFFYQSWLNFGFSYIRKKWLEMAYLLNETISIKTTENIEEGVFKDIDEEGNLILEQNKISKIFSSPFT